MKIMCNTLLGWLAAAVLLAPVGAQDAAEASAEDEIKQLQRIAKRLASEKLDRKQARELAEAVRGLQKTLARQSGSRRGRGVAGDSRRRGRARPPAAPDRSDARARGRRAARGSNRAPATGADVAGPRGRRAGRGSSQPPGAPDALPRGRGRRGADRAPEPARGRRSTGPRGSLTLPDHAPRSSASGRRSRSAVAPPSHAGSTRATGGRRSRISGPGRSSGAPDAATSGSRRSRMSIASGAPSGHGSTGSVARSRRAGGLQAPAASGAGATRSGRDAAPSGTSRRTRRAPSGADGLDAKMANDLEALLQEVRALRRLVKDLSGKAEKRFL